jgi:hypothetical protein
MCCRECTGTLHSVSAEERNARDDLRVITGLPGFLDKVVRVNGDAVAADKPGAVMVEVLLGTGCPEHFIRIDAEPGKDHPKLVHQGEGDVAPGSIMFR